MRKLNLMIALLAGLGVTSLTTAALAADKEVTITGNACCAKCALHQADKCETVLVASVDGKDVTYHLTGKEVKDFHKKICETAGEKVTVTGTETGKDGKEMIHVTKIEEVK
ncbi:MAG TPA: hypothetical protein VGI63_06460 [Verrucomicrobiae bacterium]|jgi:hypothetical protein